MGRPFLLAALAALAVSLGLGAAQANAAVSLTPSTLGAGSIVTSSVTNGSPIYNGCFNTGFRDDRVAVACPGQGIAGATQCVLFICGLPIDSSIVLVAVANGSPSGHWSFVQWQGCDVAVGTLCTILNPGTITNSRSPRAIFNDSVGPTVTAASVAYSTSTDRGVSFSGLGGNEPLTASSCRVDAGGALLPCSQVRQLSEGTHQVFAQGTDLSGNLGAISGVLATFRVIDTALVSGPTDFSTAKRPTFTYSTLAGQTFECSIDSVSVSTPCGTKDASGRASFTPPADLPDGVHTFRAEAIDGPDFDRVPLVRTWTVDTVAPVVTGLASPTITDGIVTTALTAAFTWGATEVGGLNRFECKLDDGAFAACTSGKSFSDLPFGGHTFSVRGVDKAGNTGPAVSRSWTVAARDEDGDGFNQRSDCNDSNAAINPIATDIPDNGIDENCDGADAINLDRDGDGFQRPADCNDSNPAIKPGVTDILDNGIDENCDGADSKSPPPTRVVVTMPFFVQKSTNAFTTFTELSVKGIPSGSTLKVTCKAPKGKKCPTKSFTKKNASGTVSLKKFLKKKLAAGTKVTATVTKPGNFIGAVKIMTIKKKARPSFVDRCIKPGSKKAGSC